MDQMSSQGTAEKTLLVQEQFQYNRWKQVFCCLWVKQLSQKKRQFNHQKLRGTFKRIKTDVVSQGSIVSEQEQCEPFDTLSLLFDGQQNAMEQLRKMRLLSRPDLEFYLPQLCVFMVFHEALQNTSINAFVEEIAVGDYFFSHLVYWQLYSLSRTIRNTYSQQFPQIDQQITHFLQVCSSKTPCLLNQVTPISEIDELQQNMIKEYGTSGQQASDVQLHPLQIQLNDYVPVFSEKETSSYLSPILFFEDLILLSESLNQYPSKAAKKEKLLEQLQEMNRGLPAAVYIPFSNDSVRNHAILNICYQETVLFSTNTRAPFCLCVEIFRPEDNQLFAYDQKKKVPAQQTQVLSKLEEQYRLPVDHTRKLGSRSMTQQYTLCQTNPPQIDDPLLKSHINHSPLVSEGQGQQEKLLLAKGQEQEREETWPQVTKRYNKAAWKIIKEEKKAKTPRIKLFGESNKDQTARIRAQSFYGHLKTWRLAHMIIKTGDNLKQEQFAVQLLEVFNQIFKSAGLDLQLQTYEIVSLGPDCGLIQMVRDSATIDGLKSTLHQKYGEHFSLSQVFQYYFRDGKHKKQSRRNFCRSLAASCLVCYFLQIKDRHNGNILLHQRGHIFHIDFGFFLSNMPGKGLAFEKRVPFKMLSEYADVLGGPNSHDFNLFRKHFFQGFKAIVQQREKIITIVKMVYSGHGENLPCFKEGDRSIKELESRLSPDSDGQLNVFVQKLINESLDNFRTRWYDRFQYFCQGIFY